MEPVPGETYHALLLLDPETPGLVKVRLCVHIGDHQKAMGAARKAEAAWPAGGAVEVMRSSGSGLLLIRPAGEQHRDRCAACGSCISTSLLQLAAQLEHLQDRPAKVCCAHRSQSS